MFRWSHIQANVQGSLPGYLNHCFVSSISSGLSPTGSMMSFMAMSRMAESSFFSLPPGWSAGFGSVIRSQWISTAVNLGLILIFVG